MDTHSREIPQMPTTPNRNRPRFDQETLRFLAELKTDNERPWFAANKHRCDAHVVDPALAFIDSMAPRIAEISRHFSALPKRMGGSLLRVYRDTRFARDKTPYKTNIGIQFRHERGKDVHAPGFYVHIEPGNSFLGAGIWHPEAGALRAIRAQIVEQPMLWQRARDQREFRRHFTLGGTQLAKPPRDFPADAPHSDDLRRKDFIAVCAISEREILQTSFATKVGKRFKSASGLMDFWCAALDLPF
jgi:uncharacterized protein (TIGR02453 family)